MKRVLTATTAIVGMGFAASSAQAADPINIGLSGFMNAYYSTGGEKDDFGTNGERGHFQDATINFSGSTTLDNGIEVGARFELESFGHPADEQYIYFDGSFGNLKLGSHNSASYQMGWVASGHHYTAGIPINTGWINTLVAGGSGIGANAADFREPGLSTFLDTHDDSNTISYMTPRFAGFRFGASWTPEPNVSVSGSEGQFGQVDPDAVGFHDAFSFGANFSRDFQGIGVNAAGGINIAPNEGVGNGDDVKQYTGGVNVSFAGFNVGGNVAVQDSDGANSGTDDDMNTPGVQASSSNFATTDGHSWSVGIGYTTGPWSFALEHIRSEVEGRTDLSDDDEMETYEFGADYALGPGITLSSAIARTEWQNEDGQAGVPGGGGEIQSTVAVLGASVTF